MRPEQWQKVKLLLDQALNCEPDERSAFLDQACAGDKKLREEVEAYMNYNTRADRFLEEPAFNTLKFSQMDNQIATDKETPKERDNVLERLVGKVLDDKYRIEKKLGQGGMGAVYLATHIGTKRSVALKVIMPQFTDNIEFVERFKREAEASGRLYHPNVVNVTDFGFTKFGADNIAYLVMEYLDGLTLGDLLKDRGKLPSRLVVDIVEQVCLGLDKAHKLGIIHRDLKPDNIWLEPNGRGSYNVKILDFGLAKLRDLAPATASIATQSGVVSINNPPAKFEEAKTLLMQDSFESGGVDSGALTKVGTILGTPLYMSPEQCEGRELDASSDIYSLGIIIYEMLAGETPFTGNMFQLITKHKQDTPPSLKVKRRDLPKSVVELVMSTIAKDPAHRPPTAIAFSKALRANFEGINTILDEASNLYRAHFFTFLRTSIFVSIPFFIPYLFILICELLKPIELLPQSVHRLLDLLSYLDEDLLSVALVSGLFLWSMINIGINALIVEQLRIEPANHIRLRSILSSFRRRIVPFFITELLAILYICKDLLKLIRPGVRNWIDFSFKHHIVLLGEHEGRAANAHSEILVRPLHGLVYSLRIRQYLILLQTLFISIFCLVVILPAGINILEGNAPVLSPTGLSISIGFFAFAGLLPILYTFTKYPVISIAFALLYIKARQANGDHKSVLSEYQWATPGLTKRIVDSYVTPIWKFITNLSGFSSMLLALALIFLLGSVLGEERVYRLSGAYEVLSGNNEPQNIFTPNINKLLLEAVYRGDVNTVKFLLDRLVLKNSLNDHGQSVLLIAARSGNREIVQLLLNSGATPDIRDSSGATVLIHLVKHPSLKNRLEVMNDLIAHGANLNLVDYSGRSALRIAKETNQQEVVKLLKSAGSKE
jgi:serine/threonine protein kinase